MSIVLSNRQLPMLEALAGTDFMTEGEAKHFDQRAFRSMWIRKYLDYRRGKGFYLTEQGKDARRTFYDTDIVRKNPTLPLASCFDLTLYGIAGPQKKARVKAPRSPAPRKGVRNNVREFLQKGA